LKIDCRRSNELYLNLCPGNKILGFFCFLLGKGAISEAEAYNLLTDVGVSVKVAVEDGVEVASRTVNIIKENPTLLADGKPVEHVAQEVAKIEKIIEKDVIKTGVLQKVIKEAEFKLTKPDQHPFIWETKLSNGDQLKIRFDIADYAHGLNGARDPKIPHINVELLKLSNRQIPGTTPNYEKYYNYHIIIDKNGTVVDGFGKYEGIYRNLNKKS
jgi:hypothetical protein